MISKTLEVLAEEVSKNDSTFLGLLENSHLVHLKELHL